MPEPWLSSCVDWRSCSDRIDERQARSRILDCGARWAPCLLQPTFKANRHRSNFMNTTAVRRRTRAPSFFGADFELGPLRARGLKNGHVVGLSVLALVLIFGKE